MELLIILHGLLKMIVNPLILFRPRQVAQILPQNFLDFRSHLCHLPLPRLVDGLPLGFCHKVRWDRRRLVSLLLRRGWHTLTSLLPLAMALLLLRTRLGIFFHLSTLILFLVVRVNEVPLLILLPQVVVALLGLLILEQVPHQWLGRNLLLWR